MLEWSLSLATSLTVTRSIPNLTFSAICLLLSACEGSLSVDIQGDAPAPNGSLQLAVDRIEFVHSDGQTESFTLDTTLDFDDNGLSAVNLISGEELREGNYDEIRLRILTADSRYDADTTDAVDALDIAGSNLTAVASNGSFRVREDETTSVTLHFASVLSLPQAADDASEQQLSPVMQFIGSTSSAVSATLTAPDSLDANCPADNEALPRLYLFEQSQSVDDMDGSDDARRVVFANSTLSAAVDRQWSLPRLPHDDYRFALSCDDDDPATDEDITFFCTGEASISGTTTVVLNETSGCD